ncbi:MAG: PKD domain-containing protein [Chitinophagaceae bacterium]
MKKILPSLFALFLGLFLLNPFESVASCPVSGATDVCENQSVVYSVVPNPGETYTWNVTGGGVLTGSGSSVTVTWPSIGTGTITLIVKNALNIVICTNTINVTVHGKPNPVITPSYISGCGGRKDGSGQGDKEGCLTACDSTYITYTTPFHSGSTYVWTVTGNATYTSSTNSVTVFWTGIGNGSVKVIETNIWGCSKEVEVCIEIVGKPQAAFTTLPGLTGLVVNACKNQVIQFIDQSLPGAGSPINSWSWYFGDGGNAFYTAPGNGNTSHAYANPGTYQVMLVVENECKCKDTAYVTVVVANSVGPEIFCISTVCPDATVTYTTNASGCNNYNWSVTNGVIIGSNTDSTVTVQWGSNGPGSITLSVNCPGFCNSPTTVFVPIITPNATINGPSQVCIGECYTYHISCDIPIDSIEWHFPPGVFVQTDSINVHEVQVCYFSNVSGNITADYWHFTPGAKPTINCGGSSVLPVSVKPKMFMSGNSDLCANQVYNYSISPAPTGSIYWSITNISGNTTYTSNTITGPSPFTGLWTYGPGQFIVTATDLSGNYCNSPLKKFITVHPIPPVVDTVFGPSPVCPNYSYNYTAVPTSGNYFIGWQVVNGTPSTGIGSTLSITWGPSGPYSLSVYQIDPVTGCKSAATSMSVLSALPMAPSIITGPDTVCANGSSTYSSSTAGDDYIWSINPGIAGSVGSGNHTNTIGVQWNNYNGNAWIVLTRKVCGSQRKDSILVRVINAPTPNIIIPPAICQGLNLSAISSTVASSYAWNFGDGGTASGNPGNHVYNAPGNYVITLTTTYGGSCPGTGVNTATISIWPKPNINISTPDPNLYCNPPISTTMTVAAPAIGITYQWYNPSTIGGATSTSYTATSTGNFFVVGTNSYGCKDTSNIIPISTGNCNPICTPATYTLNYNRYRLGCNTDSFNAITSPGVINLSWNFDDPYNPGGASGTPVQHTFTEPGYYRVKLCADVPNIAGTGYCNVCMYKVDTIKYVPNFFDSIYCVNYATTVPVKFVNTTKILAGYPAPSWSWLVNPGALSSTTKNPVFNLSPGTYTVSLTVAGVCTFTKTVVIPPLPNASFTVQDSVCQNTPVLFTNTSTGVGLSSTWTFGDGSSSLLTNPIRTYSNAGTYLVTLTIVNSLGCRDTAKRNIKVLPHTLSGTIVAGGPLKFCEGDSVKLTGTGIGGYPAYSYLWSTAATTSVIWAHQTGNYNLEITDTKGCFYKTGNLNVLAKTKPKPNIIGPKALCENTNYTYVANYPMIPGAVFEWYWDGMPQFINANNFSFGTYSMTPGPHQLVVTVMSPDTCYGTDTLNLILYTNPNVSITAPPVLCAGTSNMLVASSTSPGITGYYWSNGQVNDTIYTGVPNIYTVTVTDTNGCKAQASTVVNPLPDFCGLMTGCYDICDTVSNLVWHGPKGYATYQWYLNGNPIAWAVSDTFHVPLYVSGTYNLEITTAAGCTDMSDDINIDFVKCGGCSFSANLKIDCGPVSEMGNQTYSLSFNVNNSLGAGASVSITSPAGIVSNISPGTLNAGINTISATFEDTPLTDTVACFTITISNQNQICDTVICIKLPPCGQKDCKIGSKITKFDCIGHDASGNPQYYVCLSVNWSGSNGSTLTLSSPSASFTVNPVSINNGTQSICYTYTDLPPYNTFMTIYLYAFDPATGKVCKDSVRTDYKPCKDSCSVGVYGECAHCHMKEGSSWVYDIDLTVMNPFAGPATVSIPPIAAGTFGPITPNPVGPGLQNISTMFTDIAPGNQIICFKVLLTEVSSGRTCWKDVCIALPPCDSNTNIIVNLVDNYTMMVYPNPASKEVHINYQFMDGVSDISFDITDINGRTLKSVNHPYSSGDVLINTEDLAEGLYFIRVYKEGRMAGSTRLIILQRN